jgi:hypothetical protein
MKDLNILDPSILHRNSNDLMSYKSKISYKDQRRMYGSGYGVGSAGNKKKQGIATNWNILGLNLVNGSLKESMTRKKITAFKITSKNSNQDAL